MAPTVAQSWSASYAGPITATPGVVPPPSNLGVNVPVAMPAGDWAIALITWRQAFPQLPGTTVASVADDKHSWWEPLGPPTTTAGPTRCAVWYCPRSRASEQVQVSFTGPVLGATVIVLDVPGMTDWILASVRAEGGTFGTSQVVSAGAPSASALVIAVGASDGLNNTNTGPAGTGWNVLPIVQASNGSDHSSDIQQNSGWQVTTLATTATWTSTGNTDLHGLIVSLVAAPAALTQPNPNWPIVIHEAAVGSGQNTTADAMTWAPLSSPTFDLQFAQGRTYTTAALSAGQGALTADNPTGLMLPPAYPQSGGIDAGTPMRTRCYWPGGAWDVSWNGNGSTANPGISSGHLFLGAGFATPGVTYAMGAFAGMRSPWPAGVTLVINFFNGALGLISSVTSSQTATTMAATLLLAAGVAPPTTAFINCELLAAGTPPSSLTFSAAMAAPVPGGSQVPSFSSPWGVVNSSTISSQGVWAPDRRGPPNATPWYMYWSGFVERLPQQQDATYRSFTAATIIDAWAGMQENMQPVYISEVLQDGPVDYWPCTDPVGSLIASNLAVGSSVAGPMYVAQSKGGTGATTQAFGQNSEAIAGAAGAFLINPQFRVSADAGMWGQAGITGSGSTLGFVLQASSPSFPPLSGTVTVEAWFQLATPFPATNAQPILAISSPTGSLIELVADNASAPVGNLEIIGTRGTGYGPLTVYPGPVNYTSTSVLTHFVIIFNQTTYTVYVNGVQTATGSFGVTQPPTFQYVSLLGIGVGRGFPLPGVNGTAGHLAVYAGALSPARIQTHYQAGLTGLPGEAAGNRVERILNNSTNATFRRFVQYSTAPFADNVVSCLDQPGSPAGQAIQNIAGNLTPGITVITPAGELFMLSKENAFAQPIAWVLGESVSTGEIPYQGDVADDYDPTRVLNSIQITHLDNQDVVTSQVPAVTAPSQLQYGQITSNATGYLNGDLLVPFNYGPGLLDLANWYATIYRAPLLRGSQVTVDAAQFPAAWPFVLGVACADMVQFNHRPIGTAGVVGITGRVSQTQRKLTFGYQGGVAGSVQLIVDPAPETQVLTCDDPVLGLLNGQNMWGW